MPRYIEDVVYLYGWSNNPGKIITVLADRIDKDNQIVSECIVRWLFTWDEVKHPYLRGKETIAIMGTLYDFESLIKTTEEELNDLKLLLETVNQNV